MGRLLAVATAAVLLLFGSQMSHVFSDPELPEKAGRPVESTHFDKGARPSPTSPKEKPDVRYSTTHTEDFAPLLLTPDSPQGEERLGREKDDSENSVDATENRSARPYGQHPANTQSVTPYQSRQPREFTPG